MQFTKVGAGSLSWTKSMVYGFGQLLSEENVTAPTTTYIQSDYVGSPNLVTDSTGKVVGRSRNLPFGERFGSLGTAKSIRRFTNHEDQAGSSIYMQARTYLPAYGKFAQVDPAYDQTKDDPESWNLYNYVTNNPVTKTDPDGRITRVHVTNKATGAGEWITLTNQQVDELLDNGSVGITTGNGTNLTLTLQGAQQSTGTTDKQGTTPGADTGARKDALTVGEPQTTTVTYTFQATAAIHEDSVVGPGYPNGVLQNAPTVSSYAGDGANRTFDTSNKIDMGSARINLIFNVNLTLTNGSLTGISTSLSSASVAAPSHQLSPEVKIGLNTLNASITTNLNGVHGGTVSFSANAFNSLAPGSSLASIRINGDIHFSSTGAYQGIAGTTSGYPWIQIRGFQDSRVIDNMMFSPAGRSPLIELWKTVPFQTEYRR
jgi:RHS repeat-associated protein